jgi:cytochrome c
MRAISLLIWLLSISACADRQHPGRLAIERLQCGACHVIPGIAGARGQVGPPLDEYGKRVYIAGKLPRDEALLARWIADAPSLSPGTAMPKIEMTADEARDMAAYLYSLR